MGDSASRIRQLETTYIELLEKRIADLEKLATQPSRPGANPDAENLTSNDRVEQFLKNNEPGVDLKKASPDSDAGSQPLLTKIRFRTIRYKDDGVEDIQESSDNEALKVDSAAKPKDSPDIIWTKRFGEDRKYKWSEVQVLSIELRDIFRVQFAHDPRLHIVADSKNEVTILSPFEPLLQSWDSLQGLVKDDLAAESWQELRKKVEQTKRGNPTTTVEQNPEKTLSKAKEDLITLLEHVRASQDVETYLSAMKTAGTNGTIQFDNLWTIFPPGELVYSAPFMGQDQVFVVKECSSDYALESDSGHSKDERKVCNLHCWSYDWNGKAFTRVPVLFRFEEFTGAKLINTLHCHPLSYHFPGDDTEFEMQTLQDKLIARGKVFHDYCVREPGEQMFQYDNDAISHGSGFQRLKNQEKPVPQENSLWNHIMYGRRRKTDVPHKTSELRLTNGHVMVDFDSYHQHAPNASIYAPMGDIKFSNEDDECNCGSCSSNTSLRQNQRRSFDRWEGRKPFESKEQYLLCPPRVLGYHLESRTWLELNVNNIEEVDAKSDKAFDRLQLNDEHKDLIKNLVQSHSSTTDKEPMMEDIIKGKGKGLVMLLHGPPGVGKTLTAESVASLTGKPLFAVSPSDIGMNPADVERNLDSLFNLAARWRAVLLFDEADVFLESRSSNTSDLTRNALVSVLLRVLEYFKGILILTTNRIRQFDIAVLSRVNLGIKYDMLDHDGKKAIFKQFIDLVDSQQIEKKEKILDWFSTNDAKEFFKPLNGRQVRNVLFSAASLASAEGAGTLKLKHIKKMAKNTFKFQESLLHEMEKWAQRNEAGHHG